MASLRGFFSTKKKADETAIEITKIDFSIVPPKTEIPQFIKQVHLFLKHTYSIDQLTKDAFLYAINSKELTLTLPSDFREWIRISLDSLPEKNEQENFQKFLQTLSNSVSFFDFKKIPPTYAHSMNLLTQNHKSYALFLQSCELMIEKGLKYAPVSTLLTIRETCFALIAAGVMVSELNELIKKIDDLPFMKNIYVPPNTAVPSANLFIASLEINLSKLS